MEFIYYNPGTFMYLNILSISYRNLVTHENNLKDTYITKSQYMKEYNEHDM